MLLGAAIAGWVFLAAGMKERGALKHDANPLHLKGSPYGMTLAFAMRGPMDLYWHRGQVEDHGHLDEEEDDDADLSLPGTEETADHEDVEKVVRERMVRMREEAAAEEAAEAAEA
ncbi:MAG: hypothetical protein RLZ97_37, partial [Verrucomicrobiota bacterium]